MVRIVVDEAIRVAAHLNYSNNDTFYLPVFGSRTSLQGLGTHVGTATSGLSMAQKWSPTSDKSGYSKPCPRSCLKRPSHLLFWEWITSLNSSKPTNLKTNPPLRKCLNTSVVTLGYTLFLGLPILSRWFWNKLPWQAVLLLLLLHLHLSSHLFLVDFLV